MRKKHWFRRLAISVSILAISLPLLAFGLSNLYLYSSLGRAKVASLISGRLGLESSVQGSTWSPWNGISIYGVRIEQPGPLRAIFSRPIVQIRSIRIWPEWKPLLNKQLLMRGMDLVEPELTLPVELLSQIPSNPPEPAAVPPAQPPAKPPALAALPNHSGTSTAPPPSIAKSEPNLEKVPEAVIPEIPQKIPEIAPATTIPKAEVAIVVPTETIWVNVEGARVSIVSTLAKKPLYQISKIDGGIPLSGKAASSVLNLKDIRTLGTTLTDSLRIPIKWDFPTFAFGKFEGKPFGIDTGIQGQIGLTQGLPFQIEAISPKQTEKEIRIGPTIVAEIGTIVAQGVFRGYFGIPSTWQGGLQIETLKVKAEYAGHDAAFGYGRAWFVYRNGTLSCVDARMVGDELSVLANATLLSDGRASAIARVVARPETLVAISKFTEPNSAAPNLTPLSTPQRSALDLKIFGKLGDFYFQPSPMAQPVPIQ